jgi:hypothetical protein
MFRLNRYLIIASVVNVLFVAYKCAMGALGTEIAYSQPASSDAATFLMPLIAARGLAGGAFPDQGAPERVPLPLSGVSVSESLVTLSNTGAE